MNKQASQQLIELLNFMDEKDFLISYELYLGKVETPYTRAKLYNDLFALFFDKEAQNNIIDGLTKEQAILLTYVYEVSPFSTVLNQYCFEKKRSYYSSIEVNLLKRLVLIKNKIGNLIINPILLPLFLKKKFDLKSLLEEGKIVKPLESFNSFEIPDTVINSNYILGMISMITKNTPKSLKSNNVKAKIFNAFSQISDKEFLIELQKKLIASCSDKVEDLNGTQKIFIDTKIFRSLLDKTPKEIALFLMFYNDPRKAELYKLYFSMLSKIGQFSPEFAYSLILLLYEKYHFYINATSFLNNQEKILSEIKDFIGFGFFKEIKKATLKNEGLWSLNEKIFSYQKLNKSALMETSNTEFSFYGDVSGENYWIGILCQLIKMDSASTYEITKEGLQQFINYDMWKTDFPELENSNLLSQTFDGWIKEKERAKLYEGIVLVIQDDILTTVIPEIPKLQPYLLKIIQPNIFIFDSESKSKWLPILTKSINLSPELFKLKSEKEKFVKEIKNIDYISDKKPIEIEDNLIESINKEISYSTYDISSIKEKLELSSEDWKILRPSTKESALLTTRQAKILLQKGGTKGKISTLTAKRIEMVKKGLKNSNSKLMVKYQGKFFVVKPTKINEDLPEPTFDAKLFPSEKIINIIISKMNSIELIG